MGTRFLSNGVWSEITKSVKASRLSVYAAVAYFSQGAAKQLPLKRGDVLVVNACDRIVKSGQTNPSELLTLQKRGVRIFSVDNLHAKVFVVGKCAYIGSTNVSIPSAEYYVEGVLRTTDARAVKFAREFVEEMALNGLGPKQLKALRKIYNPPKFGIGKRKWIKQASRTKPILPQLFVAQLKREDWDEKTEALRNRGASVAARARKHPRTWIDDEIHWTGKCRFRKDDKLIQVMREHDGRYMVEEAATVLHVESESTTRGMQSVVFLERPNSLRRGIAAAARKCGCTQKQLRTSGVVRNRALSRKLLKSWLSV